MKKKSVWSRLGDFFMGKGFYMVLLLCVAAIGASGYYLYSLTREELAAAEETPVSAEAEVEVETETEPVSDELTEDALQKELTDVLTEAESAAETEQETETVILPQLEEPEPVQEETETEPEPEPVQETVEPETTVVEETAAASAIVTPVEGDSVAAFSSQELTYNAALGDWRTHEGVDLAAELGDPVLAAMDGEVLEVTEDVLLGTTVTINHGDGLMTVYGNLSHDVAVEQGDAVKAGDTIGTVGATAAGEWNEGNWIHFAVRQDGELTDPSDYLAKAEAP